ncbi:Alpha-1-2-mannosyltransferase [Brachionus plicatilis]|uniref:Mannosyltransferase n=1 Tax=Brachionus plicatilis TaxID=10195 RepID=A0A3M7QL76_BRAPC|nr:Alpha-1-2-mannosyltransferase [Brachionus plicatilis]
MAKGEKKLDQSDSTSNGLFFYKYISSTNSTNIFILFLTARLVSVYYNLVWDCDETYNYWDPLHFLIFGQGTQTWEYSPAYGLRSYLYLLVHYLPIFPFKPFLTSKITMFYLLRFVFALIQSYTDTKLFEGLKKLSQSDKQSFRHTHYFYLVLNLTNVGMFLSTTSFLPSTFSLYLITYAYASIYSNNLISSVFAIGLAVLLAWPFVVILGIPVAINFIIYKPIFNFVKITAISGIVILVPLVLIDSFFYGKLVVAPLNIFVYNVLDTTGKGPDLYGREPFSYYIKNLFLNFNILFPISILNVLGLFYQYLKNKTLCKNASLTYLGMFLWLLIIMTRPHKEERFMYPIYSLFIINSAILLALGSNYLVKKHKIFQIVPNMVLFIHILLSLSRLMALLFNYSSTIAVYVKLNNQDVKFSSAHLNFKSAINVCVGKEWYRFPSYFFIPEKTEVHDWNLRFLESDFKGQLPGYFKEANNFSEVIESTRHKDKLFNDVNQEVKERYVSLDKCDFIIDTDNFDDKKFNEKTKINWKSLGKFPFFDSVHNYSILRSFYIPVLYEKNVKFTHFNLRVRTP